MSARKRPRIYFAAGRWRALLANFSTGERSPAHANLAALAHCARLNAGRATTCP